MQTCKVEQVENDSRTALSKGAVQKLKERDDQKNVESDLNGNCKIYAAQTVLKQPRLKTYRQQRIKKESKFTMIQKNRGKDLPFLL